MKSLGVFLPMGLLAFWTALLSTCSPALQDPPLKVKPGTCPEITKTCKMENPPNLCHHDSQCPGAQKCCATSCGLGCVPVHDVKPGICPEIETRCLMLNPKNDCDTDSECSGSMKCCTSFCGRKCLDPRDEKPGTCPPINKKCHSLNPPNSCTQDNDCSASMKCCYTGCGLHCVEPCNVTHPSSSTGQEHPQKPTDCGSLQPHRTESPPSHTQKPPHIPPA
ncbi:antileukoproteinase [Alligator mississippiensis]|uniref:antileukoproteinase n=1 Tax=Alligator mississippiensis TaxID=8496 RepID=UPI00287788B8|nr:antileukoproteinase [Alligator mississippiensis]